jgi:hypothetical protein
VLRTALHPLFPLLTSPVLPTRDMIWSRVLSFHEVLLCSVFPTSNGLGRILLLWKVSLRRFQLRGGRRR